MRLKDDSLNIYNSINHNESFIFLIKSPNTFISCIGLYQHLKESSDKSIFLSGLNDLDKHFDKIKNIINISNDRIIIIVECTSLNNIKNIDLSYFCCSSKSKLVLILNKEHYQATIRFVNSIDKSKLKFLEDKECKYEDLTDESKSKLIECEVFFRNDIHILKDLLCINNIYELADDLKSTIDLDIFHNLINIGINEEDGNKLENIYIERTFYRFLKIDISVLNKNSDEIICIRESEFSNNINSIKYSKIKWDNLGSDPKTIIILSKEESKGFEEFESIYKHEFFQKKIIHLLNFDKIGNLFWEKTNGNLESIKKFINDDKLKIEIKEDYFNRLVNLNEQIFIISDEAGMGKSTFIERLYKNLNNFAMNKITIKIDLNKYFTALENYKIKTHDSNLGENKSIKFLLSLDDLFNTKLEKQILLNYFSSENKFKLIILFDGFDEISPFYKDTVTEIIKSLVIIKKNIKIVITTRPHLKDELENFFGVISYQMTKFTYENQKEFLINYWKMNSKFNQLDNLDKKADQVLNKLNNSINDTEKELTGIPLQLKLLSQIYLEEFDEKEELNLKILYGKFVEKKIYDMQWNEKNKMDTKNPFVKKLLEERFKKCIDEHEKLAFLFFLQNEKQLNNFKNIKNEIVKNIKNYESLNENYGIISIINQKYLKFTHKTFQEYFFSCYIVSNLKNKLVVKLFFESILIEKEYKIMRLFLNYFYAELIKFKFEIKKFEIQNCLMTVVRENLFKLVKYLVEKGADVNNGISPLLIACDRNNIEIVKYLVEKGADVNTKDINGVTPLLIACERNDINIVKHLVENGANVNEKNRFEITPLITACQKNDIEIVKYLVQKGADINAKNDDAITPLMIACQGNDIKIMKNLFEKGEFEKKFYNTVDVKINIEIVKYLVEKGANVNAKNYNRSTPLIIACYENDIEIVKYLVEKGADVNTKDINGVTPLLIACERNDINIVKHLVENGANVNEKNRFEITPLITACQKNDIEIVKYLVEKGANVNEETKNQDTPLMIALNRKNIKIVKYLVEKGANVNEKNKYEMTPLTIACNSRNFEILNYLVQNGADLNAKNNNGKTQLMVAYEINHIDLFKYLVEIGANVNEKDIYGNSIFIIACETNDIEMVKYLLEKGADVNEKGEFGYTPIIIACQRINIELIKYLVDNGGNVNTKKDNGITALMIACQRSNIEIVKYLVEKGSNVKENDDSGRTALIISLYRNDYNSFRHKTLVDEKNFEIAKYLIENGSDVNEKDNNGITSLLIACMNGKIEIVKYLVEKGADVNTKDNNGVTPLMKASEIAQIEIVKYLKEKGANISD